MLSHIDSLQLVVPDREAAVRTWAAVFGAEKVSESGSRLLNAHVTTVQAGVSQFDFLQPAGPGPVQDFASRWAQGLYGVGFATTDIGKMARHFDSQRVAYTEEKGRLVVAAAETHGMPTTIVPAVQRDRVGVINHVYEVTNPVADWQETAALYTRIFGLDPIRYSPIESQRFGYRGTLTLFDPPARLDRVEITQTFGAGAMHRFFQRRGPSLYMCYVETDDVIGLAARLEANKARYANSDDGHPDVGLFVHPSALCGMLMGVSRTNFAWVWSGRPDLAGPGAAEMHPQD